MTKENMYKSMTPKKQDQDNECKITDKKISGNTVTWKMKCSGKAPMELTGESTYKGDSMKGRTVTISNIPEQGQMKMINNFSGRRIGKCQ